MSREDDLERQLRSFGDTLRQQVGEPIDPMSRSDRPNDDDRPGWRDRRRWAALVAAAAVVALVVGLLALVQDGDEVDAPVVTQPTTPSTTTSSSSTTVRPAPSDLSLVDHVVLVDGEAVGEPWTTGVAETTDELTELWKELGLQGAAPSVDFTDDVVFYFNPAESGSCRFGPLDGVAHDPATGRVFPVLPYEDPATDVIDGERICTSDANPHAILVEIARSDLPSADFVVWVNNFDPPAMVLNRVTRVAAGELLTSPTDARSDPVQPSVVAVPSTPAPLVVTDPPPLVAIEADGDAVMLDLGTLEPVLLYDGQDPDEASQLGDGPNLVDRISVAADGSVAYVGLCCAPVVGTILATQPPTIASITATPTYGFAPTLDPSATLLAAVGPETITVTDTATDVVAELPPVADDRWGTPVDLMWLDDNTIAVLGKSTNVWTLTIITTDGTTLTAGPTRTFALIDEFPQLRFAGTAITGEIAVHDAGTDRVLSGTIDQYGNINSTGRGSSLQVVTLPSNALSAWYSGPGELVWVGTDKQLHFGDQIVPGEYSWALR